MNDEKYIQLVEALAKMSEVQMATMRLAAILRSEVQAANSMLMAMHVNEGLDVAQVKAEFATMVEQKKRENLEGVHKFLVDLGILVERSADDPWWDKPEAGG